MKEQHIPMGIFGPRPRKYKLFSRKLVVLTLLTLHAVLQPSRKIPAMNLVQYHFVKNAQIRKLVLENCKISLIPYPPLKNLSNEPTTIFLSVFFLTL